jgi:hypothetical protein
MTRLLERKDGQGLQALGFRGSERREEKRKENERERERARAVAGDVATVFRLFVERDRFIL